MTVEEYCRLKPGDLIRIHGTPVLALSRPCEEHEDVTGIGRGDDGPSVFPVRMVLEHGEYAGNVLDLLSTRP